MDNIWTIRRPPYGIINIRIDRIGGLTVAQLRKLLGLVKKYPDADNVFEFESMKQTIPDAIKAAEQAVRDAKDLYAKNFHPVSRSKIRAGDLTALRELDNIRAMKQEIKRAEAVCAGFAKNHQIIKEFTL